MDIKKFESSANIANKVINTSMVRIMFQFLINTKFTYVNNGVIINIIN